MAVSNRFYERALDRSSRKSRVKVGREIGPKLVRARREGIGAKSPRRRKAIRFVLDRRTGLLVFLDLVPWAHIRETGGVVRAKPGKKLFLQDRRRRARPGDKTFATPGGAVMAVKPGGNKKPRFVGSLKDEVKINRVPPGARMDEIAERYAPEYFRRLEEEVIRGISSGSR